MAICKEHQENQAEVLKEMGAHLAGIREAQGLSIEEISDHTKIQKRYLSAIEEGELEKLPKGLYVRSFVRQYCEYLSAMDLWQTYDALTSAETNASRASLDLQQNYSSPLKVFRPTSYWWAYVLVIASLAAAAWITWQYRSDLGTITTNPIDGGTAPITASRDMSPVSTDPISESQSPAVPDDLVTAPPVQQPSPDLSWMDGNTAPPPVPQQAAQVPAVSAPAPAAQGELLISATGNVWLRVSRDSQVLYQGTIRSGESQRFPATASQKPIRVRYGNPASAVVSWNGTVENPLAPGTKPLTRYYWPDGRVTEGD